MSNVGFEGGVGGGCGSWARTAGAASRSMNASSQAAVAERTGLGCMCTLPGANFPSPFVEDALIVALAQRKAGFGRQQAKDGRPEIEDRVVGGRSRRRHRVGSEQEAIGILIEHRGNTRDGLRCRDCVLG